MKLTLTCSIYSPSLKLGYRMSPSRSGRPCRGMAMVEYLLFEGMCTSVPHYIVTYVASCDTRTHHTTFKFDAQYRPRFNRARPVAYIGQLTPHLVTMDRIRCRIIPSPFSRQLRQFMSNSHLARHYSSPHCTLLLRCAFLPSPPVGRLTVLSPR